LLPFLPLVDHSIVRAVVLGSNAPNQVLLSPIGRDKKSGCDKKSGGDKKRQEIKKSRNAGAATRNGDKKRRQEIWAKKRQEIWSYFFLLALADVMTCRSQPLQSLTQCAPCLSE
jgi:hypothetical protein